MKKRNAKIIVDILMFLILILEMIPINTIPVGMHIVFGCALYLLFITHFILNKQWFFSVTKAFKSKKLNWKTRLKYIVDWLLIILFLISMATAAPAIAYSAGEAENLSIFAEIHGISSRLGALVVLIHVIQHIKQICSYFKRKKQKSNDCM